MVDYSRISVPFIQPHKIALEADIMRQKYRPGQPSPLDVLGIAEFDLKMGIIPIPELDSPCDTNAYITAGWDYIYIDKKQYEDSRWDKRTNFSVAHELGHFVLHKTLYESLEVKELEDFYKFHQEFTTASYSRIETQANMFAARLLVPADELRQEVEKLLIAVRDKKLAQSEIRTTLSDKFGVSDNVVFLRIVHEKIPVGDEILGDFA